MNMKYKAPEIEVIEIRVDDVMSASTPEVPFGLRSQLYGGMDE